MSRVSLVTGFTGDILANADRFAVLGHRVAVDGFAAGK